MTFPWFCLHKHHTFIYFFVNTNCYEYKLWKGSNPVLNEYSLLECFIEFWRPVVVLGFGAKLAFLVRQVWADGVNLHEGAKHGIGLPVDIVHTHNCREEVDGLELDHQTLLW